MNSQYKNPGIPETRMSDVENKHFRKAVSPIRGAVLCALATLFGAGEAFAAPITCYTPPDGVLTRTTRNCVNPSDVPKFVTQLPIPGAMKGKAMLTGLLPDTLGFQVTLRQGTQQMLPALTATGTATGFKPSTIWGYADKTQDDPINVNPDNSPVNPTLHAPGFAVVVNKNVPTEITYDNTHLPLTHPLALSQDWGLASSMLFSPSFANDPIFGNLFQGPGYGLDNRVAIHNHGLAAHSNSDGAAWDFFPNHNFQAPLANSTTYTYPNSQNGALYWFHDHAMGQTRLNAYMGLAAPYIIRDPAHPIDAMLLKALDANGTPILPLPAGALDGKYELPLVIQDRDFTDVSSTPGFNEQYFEEAPAGPERFGSVWMVNGATMPFVPVTDHVYRLRMLNGSQARVATLQIHIETSDKQTVPFKPAMYVIGHEQGANPTLSPKVNTVTIAPGERLDLLLDFRLAGKQSNGNFKFLLVNTAPAPFPGGVCLPAPAGAAVNSSGQPLASAKVINNCIPQPVWAFNAKTGLPTAAATPISQVMEFRLTRDRVPNATGVLVNAPATALDNWIATPDKPFVAKAIMPNPQTLEAQVKTKYCTGLTLPAGQVCDIPYLVSIGKIKERVFPLYDLPFTNLALGGPMTLPQGDLRYGVNINNEHYQDPGNVNVGLSTPESVQNTMITPTTVDAQGNTITTDIVEEVWTYVNTTPDAHPMHEHLFAMQAINREYLDAIRFQNDALGYPLSATSWTTTVGGTPSTLLPNPLPIDPLTGLPLPLWGDATPGATLLPVFAVPGSFVPPVAWVTRPPATVSYKDYLAKNVAKTADCGPYTTTVPAATLTCITASEAFNNNVAGAIVTNAAATSNPVPMAQEDQNWKDVIVALPGQVTRILVRTARPDGTSFTAMPTGLPAGSNSALLFNPKQGTFPMHCHILEHEENDMMTSFQVK